MDYVPSVVIIYTEKGVQLLCYDVSFVRENFCYRTSRVVIANLRLTHAVSQAAKKGIHSAHPTN